MAIDSIVAVPLSQWSLDYVTPSIECVKKEGKCQTFTFADPPDQSAIFPFVTSTQGGEARPQNLPPNFKDVTTQLLYVDKDNPITDVTGAVPRPGYYVLVANYYHPGPGNNVCGEPFSGGAFKTCLSSFEGFEMPLNITYANEGEGEMS